jgi:hypothetical protein
VGPVFEASIQFYQLNNRVVNVLLRLRGKFYHHSSHAAYFLRNLAEAFLVTGLNGSSEDASSGRRDVLNNDE